MSHLTLFLTAWEPPGSLSVQGRSEHRERGSVGRVASAWGYWSCGKPSPEGMTRRSLRLLLSQVAGKPSACSCVPLPSCPEETHGTGVLPQFSVPLPGPLWAPSSSQKDSHPYKTWCMATAAVWGHSTARPPGDSGLGRPPPLSEDLRAPPQSSRQLPSTLSSPLPPCISLPLPIHSLSELLPRSLSQPNSLSHPIPPHVQPAKLACYPTWEAGCLPCPALPL